MVDSLQISYVNNSAADCSISIKFAAGFDLVTADRLQMFKVKRSKV